MEGGHGHATKASARMMSFLNQSQSMESLEQGLLPAGQPDGAEEAAASSDTDEERCMRQRLENPEWTLDRGAGYYWEERVRGKKPCLVETGRRAGRSRVQVLGVGWNIMFSHVIRRDFFNAAVNASLWGIMAALVVVYNLMLGMWTLIYYANWRYDDFCFEGFNGVLSALLFAIETQQTIGFGSRAPGDCWMTAFLVGAHSLLAVVLNSIILGIAFARIAHPKNRGRTVLISDCAVIARRNGMLKFMFRVADIQRLRQVINPRVNAYLYTWGAGWSTAEGEHMPVRVQELRIDYLDPTLLLPVSVEHTIDERSPLHGHTQQSLADVNGEVVVVLQGSTELGNTFMIRTSYLAQEIHYGHTFVPIILPAKPGETQHSIDIARFHDVEPQLFLDMVPPKRLSQKVIHAGDRKTIPTPALAENTFVLSDDMVVAPCNGRLFLMIRVGDSFGDLHPCSQMVDVSLTAFIYRWQSQTTPEGEVLPFITDQIKFEPRDISLRYPIRAVHEIKPGSPIANWTSAQAKRQDVNAEIIVTVKGTCYATNHVVTKTKAYPLLTSVKWGHVFAPIVIPNEVGGMAAPRIDWSSFHITQPVAPSAMPSPAQTPRPIEGRTTPVATTDKPAAAVLSPNHMYALANPAHGQGLHQAPVLAAQGGSPEGGGVALSLPKLAPRRSTGGSTVAATAGGQGNLQQGLLLRPGQASPPVSLSPVSQGLHPVLQQNVQHAQLAQQAQHAQQQPQRASLPVSVGPSQGLHPALQQAAHQAQQVQQAQQAQQAQQQPQVMYVPVKSQGGGVSAEALANRQASRASSAPADQQQQAQQTQQQQQTSQQLPLHRERSRASFPGEIQSPSFHGGVGGGGQGSPVAGSPPRVMTLGFMPPGTLQAPQAAPPARGDSGSSVPGQSSTSDGDRQSTAGTASVTGQSPPGMSAEHSLALNEGTKGVGSSRTQAETWRETRSLFTALEEMKKLQHEQQQQQQLQHQLQQQQQQQLQQHHGPSQQWGLGCDVNRIEQTGEKVKRLREDAGFK